MEDKSSEEILYELEHFGMPMRFRSLEKAKELVRSGRLSQEQVCRACKKYHEEVRAENIRQYGTPYPSREQKIAHALNLFEKLKKELEEIETTPNLVKMYEGKYTSGDELYTNRPNGCIVTLLYFESPGIREGILTHYPPLGILDNIEKLKELKEQNLKTNYQKQRGIILIKRPTKASQLLETAIREMFPQIKLQTIMYDPDTVGTVSLNPSQREWGTAQHGINYF